MADTAARPDPANALDALRALGTVVADTGEISAIRKFAPTDATTNPSLVLAAAQLPEYRALFDEAAAYGQQNGSDRGAAAAMAVDRLMCLFGREITRHIPRYVSTEVAARLSFDTAATIEKGRALHALYADLGVASDRILIKIASTWEGIRAAAVLEAEGVRCNMTLIFSLAQAAACFDAGVTLISPFVGRITDWYKQAQGVAHFEAEDDPGVQSVRRIHAYARRFGYRTDVMGASFRNSDQIRALAGCDLLTISPALLDELQGMPAGSVSHAIERSGEDAASRLRLNERDFRWAINEDAMATDKLAEGIRRFASDQDRLEALLADAMG